MSVATASSGQGIVGPRPDHVEFLPAIYEPQRLLQLSVVGETNESFKRDDLYKRGVNQVLGELAGGVVVAQFPSVATEEWKGASTVAARNGVRQAHDLERNFLLGGAAGLLPFERNEDLLVVLLDNGVNFVDTPAAALADLLLAQRSVATTG